MRCHLPNDRQPDPALTQAIAAMMDTVGLLNLVLTDAPFELPTRSRMIAVQLQGRELIRAAAALKDLAARTAK